jgi:predicted adenylyl cyclase CyaB
MPTNIEIKARVRDWDRTRRAAETLTDRPLQIIDQHDTFFACQSGRLKLREFSATSGELIAYERDDVPGTKVSRYLISATSEPAQLRDVLQRALGLAGLVKKRRYLYLHGPTRIHLDDVEGLGKFLELEVVLAPDEDEAKGEAIARELMQKLSVQPEDLLAGAYVDRFRSTCPTAP